jgi:hypothetical protein
MRYFPDIPDNPDIIITHPFSRLPLGILQPIREARVMPEHVILPDLPPLCESSSGEGEDYILKSGKSRQDEL